MHKIRIKTLLLATVWFVWFVCFGLADNVLQAQQTSGTTERGNRCGYLFNRPPLAHKPFTELPLGSIEPHGWLRDELRRMALGMTGNLDRWYPEVCGPRNAWLGGDGDCWERGPYWIDGLYPLAKSLGDKSLEAKAMQWVNWTLENQRDDGYIGPRQMANRTQPPPQGAQIKEPDDWWPRMVMLKILQQHYLASGDERVIDCMTRYFKHQLKQLPNAPLHQPGNPDSGSWWAMQRGGDNMMSVLWLYNVTGDAFLLELADLLHQQTIPVTDYFSPGPQNMVVRRFDRGDGGLHCVNLAQMMKTPIIRWQQDQDLRHLEAVDNAFNDIHRFHGQPTGLYGGDEEMHGDSPNRGSELCTAVEMMYSLEKMFEITGDASFGDRLERIAFNALPTQCTDDYHGRQYYQQTNQVAATMGDRDFFDDGGDRIVYGLIKGYPCCTCNLHQGWPKFAQHLWMASADGGLGLVAYAPSSVTANVTAGVKATLTLETDYPFKERSTITVDVAQPTEFTLSLRIPGWSKGTEIVVNGEKEKDVRSGTMHAIRRTWNPGEEIKIRFPMQVTTSRWYANSRCFERGPLVYALDVAATRKDIDDPNPTSGRGHVEFTPVAAWNYALPGPIANSAKDNKQVRLEIADSIPDNPWTSETAPVQIKVPGVRLPYWTLYRGSAPPPPLSPVPKPNTLERAELTLIPYGATTLRITEFPWLRREDVE